MQCELTRQDLAVISTRDVERREANWRASMGVRVSVNSYVGGHRAEGAEACVGDVRGREGWKC